MGYAPNPSGVKQDLASQAYEHARKLLVSTSNIIHAATPEARDASYQETMRHLADYAEHLGRWRLIVTGLQHEQNGENKGG